MRVLELKRLDHEYLEYFANIKERQIKLKKEEERLNRLITEEIKTLENKKIAQEIFQKRLDKNAEDANKLIENHADFLKLSLNLI